MCVRVLGVESDFISKFIVEESDLIDGLDIIINFFDVGFFCNVK